MEIVSTTEAPAAIGPYSQAVSAGGLLITSGQLGIDPRTGELAEGLEAQATLALQNLRAILEEAGCTMSDVMKTTVFLTDMADFPAANTVYEQAFGEHKPARSCVAVAALPKGGIFEIECIAVRS